MKLSLRFILPLFAILALIAYGITPLVDALTLRWFTRDLDIRANLVASSITDVASDSSETKSNTKLVGVLNRITQDERLIAAGLCNINGQLVIRTQLFPTEVTCQAPSDQRSETKTLKAGTIHIARVPIDSTNPSIQKLILVHDMSFIEKRSSDTRTYLIVFFIGLGFIISTLTVFIAQLSWRGWVTTLRSFISGEGLLKPISDKKTSEFGPILKEFRSLIKTIETGQRVRDESLISWTPKTLKEILGRELAGEEIITLSNREPYIHHRKPDGTTEVRFPASGLVTALEPVMRACSGTWVAHGSGNADRANVDAHDRVKVPPDNPNYTLRRVWITDEEELGYYYGFANEGLWPLCHIAHTRPIFRTQDWEQYVKVNQKFADAVIKEAKTNDPVVLVQDYHFALAPKMIRKKLPNATIISFWHIPWPNPEAFGICPWREEILEGILGSSIVGFHIQFHCNNFIETVDRFLECRIDREHSTISYSGKITAINPYPISIEWPGRWAATQKSIAECKKIVRNREQISEDIKIGLGVDRLDYTKGILERLSSVERLFELHPEWIGKFTFIQIAAPSRSSLDTYKRLEYDVRALADRINQRYKNGMYQPIILKIEHHEPPLVLEYFRAADLCVVSSLHDGMNLVAKEYIAARDDELGTLILSLFTGASRELPEALVVNPYDIDQCGEALHIALNMPPAEQRERLRSMRSYVREFNIFRWAGRMLIDAARIRQRNRLMRRVSRLSRLDKEL